MQNSILKDNLQAEIHKLSSPLEYFQVAIEYPSDKFCIQYCTADIYDCAQDQNLQFYEQFNKIQNYFKDQLYYIQYEWDQQSVEWAQNFARAQLDEEQITQPFNFFILSQGSFSHLYLDSKSHPNCDWFEGENGILQFFQNLNDHKSSEDQKHSEITNLQLENISNHNQGQKKIQDDIKITVEMPQNLQNKNDNMKAERVKSRQIHQMQVCDKKTIQMNEFQDDKDIEEDELNISKNPPQESHIHKISIIKNDIIPQENHLKQEEQNQKIKAENMRKASVQTQIHKVSIMNNLNNENQNFQSQSFTADIKSIDDQKQGMKKMNDSNIFSNPSEFDQLFDNKQKKELKSVQVHLVSKK